MTELNNEGKLGTPNWATFPSSFIEETDRLRQLISTQPDADRALELFQGLRRASNTETLAYLLLGRFEREFVHTGTVLPEIANTRTALQERAKQEATTKSGIYAQTMLEIQKSSTTNLRAAYLMVKAAFDTIISTTAAEMKISDIQDRMFLELALLDCLTATQDNVQSEGNV